MTESRPPDDRLLEAAAAIARGEPVDWAEMPLGTDSETTTVVAQLQALEGLSQRSNPVPNAWGPFTILGEIGHGSFGTVYRAIDPTLNIEVALKIIRPRKPISDADFARALNEARLLAQINHPHVVRVFHAQRIDDEVGLSMELVKGRTLNRIIQTDGPLSASEAVLLGVDLCYALAAVHGAQLLHGDIKAHNVMRAEGGRTVLMDFGAGDDLKRETQPSGRHVTGTPLYLAPELFGGGVRSRASDIYSLGVLLFHAMTGSYPVEGHTRDEVEAQHASQAPPRLLRDVRTDVPDAVIAVVERATARRPQDRFQSAGEFETALRRALRNDEPAPAPTPLPFRRWVLVAGALAAAVLGYGLWGRASDADRRTSALPESPAIVEATPAPDANAYQIEAAFYREEGDRSVRLQAGAQVARGDRISLQVLSSVPSYVYVVNEDDQGEAYLLFPLPGQTLSNPLPPHKRHDVPGRLDGERMTWQVTSAGGREHFLIFVSPAPPAPAFERLFAGLPRPTIDRPASPITGEMRSVLRGVGGLVKAPVRPSPTGLTEEFATPLPAAGETASGVWVRQLTLENPRR